MKKTIRLYSSDFQSKYANKSFLTGFLQERYNIIIDKENPDFLLCGCFGITHFKYNCVKIYYTGENLTPDMNLYDYAMGFDYMDFEDRYFRLPYYRLFLSHEDFQHKDKTYFQNLSTQKTDFCNFIYSNSNRAAPERETIFRLLSQYKKVNSGGGFLNNIGERVNDKITWQRKHKFSIAFENSNKSGYTTEKIYDALKADTIPIYWGNRRIAEEFNTKRFINCHDYATFEDAVAEVKRLDNDEAAYIEMLSQPWFNGSAPPELHNDQKFKDWLYHIFDQKPETAYRTTRYGWTFLYRKRISKLNIYRRIKSNNFYKRLFKSIRKVRKRFYRLLNIQK